MDNKQLFKQYYSRLALEGAIKALICGFIVGFSASFIAALATFLAHYNGLWISIGIGLGAVFATAPLFYFKMFRPTTKKIAQRLDRLGLEERLITMMELEKDESYIAMRQREDAKEKLNSVNPKMLKVSVFVVPIIAVAVLAILSTSMITISALGIPGQGGPVVEETEPPEEPLEYIYVSYVVEAGGFVSGESEQLVLPGQDANTVTAIADEGYAFAQWSDELLDAERTDKNILEEFSVTAIFVKVEDSEDNNSDPDQQPSTPDENDDEYNSTTLDNNQIIDGETDYRDYYKEYLDQAMQALSEGGDVSDELRALIEQYFKSLT